MAARRHSENIFRELASRHGTNYGVTEVIRRAARDVERPIFYAIAVIMPATRRSYV